MVVDDSSCYDFSTVKYSVRHTEKWMKKNLLFRHAGLIAFNECIDQIKGESFQGSLEHQNRL